MTQSACASSPLRTEIRPPDYPFNTPNKRATDKTKPSITTPLALSLSLSTKSTTQSKCAHVASAAKYSTTAKAIVLVVISLGVASIIYINGRHLVVRLLLQSKELPHHFPQAVALLLLLAPATAAAARRRGAAAPRLVAVLHVVAVGRSRGVHARAVRRGYDVELRKRAQLPVVSPLEGLFRRAALVEAPGLLFRPATGEGYPLAPAAQGCLHEGGRRELFQAAVAATGCAFHLVRFG